MRKFLKMIGEGILAIGGIILTILIFLQGLIGAILGCLLMVCFGLAIIAGVCYVLARVWNITF